MTNDTIWTRFLKSCLSSFSFEDIQDKGFTGNMAMGGTSFAHKFKILLGVWILLENGVLKKRQWLWGEIMNF